MIDDIDYYQLLNELTSLKYDNIENNKKLVELCIVEYEDIVRTFAQLTNDTPEETVANQIEHAYQVVGYILPIYLIKLSESEDYENAAAIRNIGVAIITKVNSSIYPNSYDHEKTVAEAKEMIIKSVELIKNIIAKWKE